MSFNPPTSDIEQFLPMARGRLFLRGLVWGAGGLLLGVLAREIFAKLDFTRTGVHSRLVEASLAVVALPIAFGSAGCVWHAFRCLLVALWVGELGITLRANSLELRLGPFGSRAYPLGELAIKYPFELSGDEESFEAFLPEELQRATMLPRITHPSEKVPISRQILRFARGTEPEIAQRIRPWVERVTGVSTGP